MNPRVRAACDLMVGEAREYAGLHDYDGVLQDLSPAGVARGLSVLGQGPTEPDAHDEAQLTGYERGLRTVFAVVEEHRRNPLYHVANLDVACYQREYAPAEERAGARARHLAGWPDAVDAAIDALDLVAAPVARSLLGAAAGLPADVTPDEPGADVALAAHARLMAHLEDLAEHGPPDAALGHEFLTRLLADTEAIAVDLGRMAEQADAERDRLRLLIDEACDRLEPGTPVAELLPRLLRDHPDTPEEIYAEASAQIDEATRFTIERDLLADPGGVCLVGPAPPARRYAMAMMSWSAPYEPDAPSWYYVTPPDESWPDDAKEEWLSVFSRTTLPAITVHEVTPGHYAHGRMLRQVTSDVRRCLGSMSFVEGWAHYAEELFVEEGFRADDPRFAIGVGLEAILRVTRLAASIGLHTGAMTLDEAIHRFEADAFIRGPAARAEAERGLYDPTYGRYTWGKLEIKRVRDEARRAWGVGYSHRRFHEAMLDLGAPLLGLLEPGVLSP